MLLKDEKDAKKNVRYPLFDGLTEAAGHCFSDAVHAKKSTTAFIDDFAQCVAGAGIYISKFDTSHMDAWKKLLQTAERQFQSVQIDKGTSINERFHAHLRFYCVKGDVMSIAQWKVLVMFAFLSFNNFPNWQKKVIKLFCETFKD